MNKVITRKKINIELLEYMSSKNLITRDSAINMFLKIYCPDIYKKSSKLNFLGQKNNNNEFINTPVGYSKWILNFAFDFINISNGLVRFNVIADDEKYKEINYEVVNSNTFEDSYIDILCSNNGLIVEINGEVLSIAKNREQENVWNANFSPNLNTGIPLVRKKRINNYRKIYR